MSRVRVYMKSNTMAVTLSSIVFFLHLVSVFKLSFYRSSDQCCVENSVMKQVGYNNVNVKSYLSQGIRRLTHFSKNEQA